MARQRRSRCLESPDLYDAIFLVAHSHWGAGYPYPDERDSRWGRGGFGVFSCSGSTTRHSTEFGRRANSPRTLRNGKSRGRWRLVYFLVQRSVLGGSHRGRVRYRRSCQGTRVQPHSSSKSTLTRLSQVIQISASQRPMTLLTLDPSPAHAASTMQSLTGSADAPADADSPSPASYAVTSVAWAPSCGRSYHLIATGCRDGKVRIWKVKPAAEDAEGDEGEEGRWSATIVADFDNHK